MSLVILATGCRKFGELTILNSVTIVSGLRLKYLIVDTVNDSWNSMMTKGAVWTCVEVNAAIICGTYLNAAKPSS